MGVEPKKSAYKRTLRLEGLLSLRPWTPETVDALASFEAEGEDREPEDLCDEREFDDEPDHDNEPSGGL